MKMSMSAEILLRRENRKQWLSVSGIWQNNEGVS